MQSKGMVIYVLKDLWEIWTLNESIFKYFPGSSVSKESTWSAGGSGSILGREDPLEKEMATNFSILAWEVPWTKDRGT